MNLWPARSTPSSIIPRSRSWKPPGEGSPTWSNKLPDDGFDQDPGAQRLLGRTGPGPDPSPRVRPEPALPQGLRGRIRPPGGRTLRRPAGRLRDPASAPVPIIPTTISRCSPRSRAWRPPPSPRSSPGSIPPSSAWTASPNWNGRSTSPRAFEQVEYLKWRSFRQSEDARFVGLTLPRVLMRLPYEPGDPGAGRKLHFREEVEGPDRSKYLWGKCRLRLRRRADPVLRQLGLAGRHSRRPSRDRASGASRSAWMTEGW